MKVTFTLECSMELGGPEDYDEIPEATPDDAAGFELNKLCVIHADGVEVTWSVSSVTPLGSTWGNE